MKYEDNQVVILIPVLNPDNRFVNLINDLIDHDFKDIIVVNDGSHEKYDKYFEQVKDNVMYLKHAINLGKGRALKTGFNEYLNYYHDKLGVITVDADGQHQVDDIIKVAEAMKEHPRSLVLGVRNFYTPNIPKKNRIGNIITRNLLHFFAGINIQDTQTGLRGITNLFMKYLLRVKGERYEYEMNMLIESRERDVRIYEVPINTIYLDGNKSSHFHAFRDSAKIYNTFLKCVLSSAFSWGIDILLFALLVTYLFNDLNDHNLTIIFATTIARIISSLTNYLINKKRIFRYQKKDSIYRYLILIVGLLILSAFFTSLLYSITKSSMTFLKLIVDFCLFFVNYRMQREWVFKYTDQDLFKEGE